MHAESAVINDRYVSVNGLTADKARAKEVPKDDSFYRKECTTNRQGHLSKGSDRSRHPIPLAPISPSMALKMSFADWRQASSDNLLATAETLLDELDSVAELLTQIDEKLITGDQGLITGDEERDNIVQRFHAGVESAKSVVFALKREKWRLSKREMSVELKMGELEEYKSHLKNDMSSLNQTVDVLSLRIVQLENQLVEAQEVQETLEAEVMEHKKKAEQATNNCSALQIDNENLRRDLKIFTSHTSHTLATENTMLKNEVVILQDENKRLKELVRNAEVHPNQQKDNGDDHLARLTRDFLRQLSSLDDEDNAKCKSTECMSHPLEQQTDESNR